MASKLHIQRPKLVASREECEYYVCKCCYRSVPKTDFAALAEPSIPIVEKCARCSAGKCCVPDCPRKFESASECKKHKIDFIPCCNVHKFDTCRHSRTCECDIAYGVFCEEHVCQGKISTGKQCLFERVKGCDLCPIHIRDKK